MGKKIKFNKEARDLIKEGIDGVADAVKVTMGARGRNVIIDRGYPYITKDGVTVASEIYFDEPLKNLGAQMVKLAASKTCDNAGDGTSAASVLTQAMIEEGLKLLSKGCNPMDLKKGIDQAVRQVVEYLKASSKQVKNDKGFIKKVATVSANNDREIGDIIAKAFDKVSSKGVVKVEETKSFETKLKIIDGFTTDKGYISPFFINAPKDECILEDPYILITDKKIQTLDSFFPLIEKIGPTGRPLLIICDDIDVAPLSSLLLNLKKGTFLSCVIKTPSFGDIRKDLLEDIAITTGGRYLTDDKADKLSKVELTDLGECKKVIVGKNETTIISGKGKKDKIKERAEHIQTLIKEEDNQFKKDAFNERIAKLIGGVAMISIGGGSEAEVREKADRIDDSIHATKAAFEEGVVPGGGIMFMRASANLNLLSSGNKDMQKGINLVRIAIQKPFTTILSNAGIKANKYLILEAKDSYGNKGYDVIQEEMVDMFVTGIVDPVKVLRLALVNAASVAGLFLTTECSITNE